MIFLIGGIVCAVTFFAGIGQGVLGVLLYGIGAVLFIAGGIQKLTGNDPDTALEAIRRLQQEGPPVHPLSAQEIRRLPGLVRESGQPLNAEQIRQLQELAQRSGHPFSAEEIRLLQEQTQSRNAGSAKPRTPRQPK